MPSLWWLKEICPSVSPRRMASDGQAGHKGTPTSRSSKRSKAKRRDRVRTWAQPSPLGLEWQALCVRKRRPDEQLNQPEPSSAQTVPPHHLRHARTLQVSDHPPRSGAPHQVKRRPKPSAQRWALSWGIRRAPKGGVVAGQPKCNDRAARCETPLLERPRRLVHSAHAAGLWPAPSGRRPEESGAVKPRTETAGLAFRPVPNPACVRVMQNQPGSGRLMERRHDDEQSRRHPAHAHA